MMYVRMIQTLATPAQAYLAGQVYEVTDAIADLFAIGGVAEETDELPPHIRNFFDWLDVGAGRPCLFLPHLGEFGHKICTAVRLIHWHRSSHKIVCCRRGEEVLYPSAAGYITDWQEPPHIRDSARAGTMQSPTEYWPQIIASLPSHMPIEQGGLTPAQEMLALHPEHRIPFRPRRRGLRADVILGVRRRNFHDSKNWPEDRWQSVAAALRAEGLTYAVIGDRASSYDLPGQECHSGDYDTDAAIELMQNSRVYVGTDTGSAHLAATVGARMIVMREEHFGRDWIPRMELVNPGRVCRVEGAWYEPAKVADAIKEYFREYFAPVSTEPAHK